MFIGRLPHTASPVRGSLPIASEREIMTTPTANPNDDIAAFLDDAIGIIKEMSRDATDGQ